ncbi:MAG: hypothetical protein LBI29_00720 [Rickettsiales bacterium]|jgi:hypothetical protein|nr:hypothetical protein [Rickettsiales bacterium]
MDVVRNMQKLIYGQLRGIDFGVDTGIYSYPPRGIDFPYILISMEESGTSQNFGYEAVRVKTKIEVFDRSENNARILEISDDIVASMESLRAIIFEDSRIIGVFFDGNELKLHSEISPTWSNSLNFELAVERISR